MQPIAKQLFHSLGGLHWIRRRNRDGFRILMYHRFWPASEALQGSWMLQLDHLRRNYVVRSLAEIVSDLTEGKPLLPNTLAITIDDGHRDFYTVAYPALRKMKLPATVFLTTAYLDGQMWLWFDEVIYAFRNARAPHIDADAPGMQPRRLGLATPEQKRAAATVVVDALQPLPADTRLAWTKNLAERLDAPVPTLPEEEYAPLAWAEVREMNRNGISFGAHTVTHPTLSSLPDDAALAWELTESKRRVEEEIQREAPIFCYPNGRFADVGDRIVAATRAAGYRAAVLAEPGLNTPATDLFHLRRMSADPDAEYLYFQRQCAVMNR